MKLDRVWVDTVEEYAALPRGKRLLFGVIYRTPFALEWGEWEAYHAHMLATHPIQYRIREWADSAATRIYDLWDKVPRLWRWCFNPPHPLVRKSIPREWRDLDSLMEDINFAIIRQFRQEMIDGCVDWKATEGHAEFERWIISAVDYLDNARPKMVDPETNPTPSGEFPLTLKQRENCENEDEWQAWSDECRRRDEAVEAADTALLIEAVKRRGYFWT